MLEYIKTEANRAYTENGALSYATTHSDCLDLFATIGALRSAENQEIISRFQGAFAEDPDLAMKTLFFARDVRGGLGERKVFRVAMKWLAENAPASVRKNLPYIAEYGRWDDLLALMGTACEKDALNLIKDQLDKDYMAMDMGDEVSLLLYLSYNLQYSRIQPWYALRKTSGSLTEGTARFNRYIPMLHCFFRAEQWLSVSIHL